MDGDPPNFSRPVELDGRKTDAKFRTVTVRAGIFPRGEFISEHVPGTCLAAGWQSHRNGIEAVSEIVVVTREPAKSADLYIKFSGLL